MPYYADLRPNQPGPEWKADEPGRNRAVERLLALRRALADGNGAPPPRSEQSLLLATWNIREFDSPKWGPRIAESYAYIAEIVDRFDVVAIQEVREDLHALDRLLFRLGRNWRYLVSDVTEGRAGNGERLAYLYDSRKVQFLGVAGELVLPPVTVGKKTTPAAQIARTPLMAAFQVGWTKFVLGTVHILYGAKTAEPVARVEEIRKVARFLRARTETTTEPYRNFIVLGDFNIFSSSDSTMQALVKDGGFTVPAGITDLPGTNVPKNKKYDQIAFRARSGRFEATGRAGAFDYYEHVFTSDETPAYRPYIEKYIQERHTNGLATPKLPADASQWKAAYRQWRTYQMSDHLPLWTEFRIDFADEYLRGLAVG